MFTILVKLVHKKKFYEWVLFFGKKGLARSHCTFNDAWLANNSAQDMAKLLRHSGFNVKVRCTTYDIICRTKKSQRKRERKVLKSNHGFQVVAG